MSTKSKLLAMTENLELPVDAPATGVNPAVTGAADGASLTAENVSLTTGHKFPPVATGGVSPRTGPGQMLQFRGHMLAAEGEVSKLREKLKEHEGASATRKLDPKDVVPSRFANRHDDSFDAPEFARLKQDIELAGGNVQPISVRPIAEQPGTYEIVFGHRRHRACRDLGIPVLATIDASALSDLDLFSAMDRENRERVDLSAYEQGAMYRRALDEKLYPSNRRLAEALGVSHTWVANVLQVADLPAPVLDCFRSRLEVQPRHAKTLAAALETDRKGVLRRADKLRTQDSKRMAAAVVAALTGQSPEPVGRSYQTITVTGESVGRWSKDGAGRLLVEIDAKHATDAKRHAVLAAVAAALNS